MSGSLRINKWIQAGFEDIVTCSGTQTEIARITEGICARANANNMRGGNGFASATKLGRAYGKTRAIGLVYTTDHKSMVAEAEDKALSRAVM